MTVRSKVLAQLGLTTSLLTVYTCPSGRTAIVKAVSVSKVAPAALDVTWTLKRGASSRMVAISNFAVGNAALTFAPYWVLEPADVLQAQCSAGAAATWVSGVELEGVAPA